MSEYAELYRKFSFAPKNEDLYRIAFTYSYHNGIDGSKPQEYERMQFVGDSIIDVVVSELCYRHHPLLDKSRLSILKTQFTKGEVEAEYCKKLDLNRYIRVAPSFQGEAIDSVDILEDVFEAFIGALYLDQGLGFVHEFLVKLFDEDIKYSAIEGSQNPKIALQEAMHAHRKKTLVYKILKENGRNSRDKRRFFQNGKFGNIDKKTGD